jgi:hypothetical protein
MRTAIGRILVALSEPINQFDVIRPQNCNVFVTSVAYPPSQGPRLILQSVSRLGCLGCGMSWKLERDSLITQTLVFVRSVAGKREESDNADAGLAQSDEPVTCWPDPAALPHALSSEILQAIEAPPSVLPTAPVPPPQPATTSDMAAEIRARVAGFRAHQERFNRERENYFAATLARLRAAIEDIPPPRPNKERR